MFVITVPDPHRPWFHHRVYGAFGDAEEALGRINQRRRAHGLTPAVICELVPAGQQGLL